jgi:hypothetical protein
MFSVQCTRILDFPSKIALHTADFYIMTLVLCQEAYLFLDITKDSCAWNNQDIIFKPYRFPALTSGSVKQVRISMFMTVHRLKF